MHGQDTDRNSNVVAFPGRRVAPATGSRALLLRVGETGYLILDASERESRALAVALATFGFVEVGAMGPDGGVIPLGPQDLLRPDARLWLLSRGELFPGS